jgi:hypothetical protein
MAKGWTLNITAKGPDDKPFSFAIFVGVNLKWEGGDIGIEGGRVEISDVMGAVNGTVLLQGYEDADKDHPLVNALMRLDGYKFYDHNADSIPKGTKGTGSFLPKMSHLPDWKGFEKAFHFEVTAAP